MLAAVTVGAGSELLVGRRKRGTPLTVSIDIADVVLVALHCAIAPEAESIAEDWLDQLVWTPFVREAEETAIPPQTIRVRPAIYAAGASVLAFSVADALPDGKLAPGGALVRVRPPDEDDG